MIERRRKPKNCSAEPTIDGCSALNQSELTASEVQCTMVYTMPKTAKLFRNGRSQAVRLPAEYRFERAEVYIRRNPHNGDVILSRRPETWDDLFELLAATDIPDNFLAHRKDAPPQKRELF